MSFAVPQVCYRKGNICESENFVVLLWQIIHASASISWLNKRLAAVIAMDLPLKYQTISMDMKWVSVATMQALLFTQCFHMAG